MLFSSSILSSALRAALLITYLMGVLFGGGLHPHESLHHEHDDALLHSHTWVAHIHDAAVVPNAGSESEIISPAEHEHQHPVPAVRLIAVPASNLALAKSIQHNIACSGDLLQISSFDPSLSILFVFPHETSPPLRSPTGLSGLGRSPPLA